MIFTETKIGGSYLVELEFTTDHRGFFARLFCKSEFEAVGLIADWVQVNNSLSLRAGTLRGPHLQRSPHEEAKLVRCVRGSVWDVIVDLRPESSTFGQWFGTTLAAGKAEMMYVPPGVAHGVLALEDNSEIIYATSTAYAPGYEIPVLWNDDAIGIAWPITPTVMSEKEKNGTGLEEIRDILRSEARERT